MESSETEVDKTNSDQHGNSPSGTSNAYDNSPIDMVMRPKSLDQGTPTAEAKTMDGDKENEVAETIGGDSFATYESVDQGQAREKLNVENLREEEKEESDAPETRIGKEDMEQTEQSLEPSVFGGNDDDNKNDNDVDIPQKCNGIKDTDEGSTEAEEFDSICKTPVEQNEETYGAENLIKKDKKQETNESPSECAVSAEESNTREDQTSPTSQQMSSPKPRMEGSESEGIATAEKHNDDSQSVAEQSDQQQDEFNSSENDQNLLQNQVESSSPPDSNNAEAESSNKGPTINNPPDAFSFINPVIKAEPTSGGFSDTDNQEEDNNEGSKEKEEMLRMLNIPQQDRSKITEEELNTLIKYVYNNPSFGDGKSKKSKSKGKKLKKSTQNIFAAQRKVAKRKLTDVGPPAKRGRPPKSSLKNTSVSADDNEEETTGANDGKKESEKKLPLEIKYKIIRLKGKGLTNVKIAEKLGLSNSRVWRIVQKKDEILKEAKRIGLISKIKRSEQVDGDEELIESSGEEDEDKLPSENDPELLKTEVEDDGMENLQVYPRRTKSKMFKPRRDLTLADRRKVIETLEATKAKIKDLAKKFGVSTSSISRIKRNKEVMKLRLETGDLCGSLRRWRDCKDPELDKVLTKWYRAFETMYSTAEPGGTVSVSNTLLKEKAHDLALIMGTEYYATDNWILRWKNRHNIRSRMNNITDRGIFTNMDAAIDISVILDALGKQQFKMDEVKREALRQPKCKPEEFIVCEHCGVLISSKRKRLDHIPGCPGALSRKDLTLCEKAEVVKQLEKPGVTMISIARKFGVSTSAISRIHKSRVEILARVAEGGKSLARRKRDRPSKEPEVEKLLCDWYRGQRDLGLHVASSTIRDKAREIAKALEKDFWPSESWVFRWRHRHNMTGHPSELENEEGDDDDDDDDDEEDEEEDPQETKCGQVLDALTGELVDVQDPNSAVGMGDDKSKPTVPKVKKQRAPKLIMCEKCGCVSSRKKNARFGRLRHAKGCPDVRQRNERTYEDRAKMVHALEEPGATLSSVARQFGVSVSSMSRIRQRKDEILSFTGRKSESKRIRSCKEPEIAEMLYQYFLEKKAEGIYINGPKLKEKAAKLAQEMGREFKVSSGWLGRWRHRYNVFTQPKLPGEKSHHNMSTKPRRKQQQQRRQKAGRESGRQQIQVDEGQAQYSGDATSLAVLEELEPVPAPIPQSSGPLQPGVFLHRGFQSPWDLVNQQQQAQQAAGSWRDLVPGAVGTSDHDPVTYTYTESPAGMLAKPLFHPHHPHHTHNMFDSFPASMGYHVATLPPGLESAGNLVNRDFLKDDGDNIGVGNIKTNAGSSSNHHHGHPSHLTHSSLLSQSTHQGHLSASSSPSSSMPPQHHHHHHLTHHPSQLAQHHSRPSQSHLRHSSHQQQPVHHHHNSSVAASATPTREEDSDQPRHLLDALKMMHTFAARNALGDQVQSALRTLEMSMKKQM